MNLFSFPPAFIPLRVQFFPSFTHRCICSFRFPSSHTPCVYKTHTHTKHILLFPLPRQHHRCHDRHRNTHCNIKCNPQQEPLGKVNETAKNAARERTRVKSLRDAFSRLQSLIPNVPPDTKLSKLDVLILASSYIRHLSDLLNYGDTITPTTTTAEATSANGNPLHMVDTMPSSRGLTGRANLHVDKGHLHPANHECRTLSDIAINCNNIALVALTDSTDGQSAPRVSSSLAQCANGKSNSLVDSAIASCNSYSNSGNKYLRPVRVSVDEEQETTCRASPRT